MRHTKRLAAAAHVQRGALGEPALVDAANAHLAHEGIDDDFEDMGQHVKAGIGLDGDGRGSVTFTVQKTWRVGL